MCPRTVESQTVTRECIMFNVNRNGRFHFKFRIPYDLTDIVGFTHIQCPLKTKQKRVANKLSLELRDRIIP